MCSASSRRPLRYCRVLPPTPVDRRTVGRWCRECPQYDISNVRLLIPASKEGWREPHGFMLPRIPENGTVALTGGRTLIVRRGEVGVIGDDSLFRALPTGEHIIFGDTLFIPPEGAKNRRIVGALGPYPCYSRTASASTARPSANRLAMPRRTDASGFRMPTSRGSTITYPRGRRFSSTDERRRKGCRGIRFQRAMIRTVSAASPSRAR